MSGSLMALKGPLGNMPSFRKAIEHVITDETSRKNVLDELGLDVASQR
ncbi:Type VI secretion protein, family [Pseudomonas amygdali pv. aesculi]|nr:Type VI secretion protein, family [Pseudomonas amygdali pv. aesculi]